MLQTYVITLREGLEAFLIVAISLAYLRKIDRKDLVPAVHWGIVCAVLLSGAAGYLFSKASNQPLWEGILAMVAALLVAWLTIHMWRAGRRIRSEIEGRLQSSILMKGAAASLAVFMFTLLMITREGMETALLISALLFQVQETSFAIGAALGILTAALIAWLWSRYGHRVNLGRFLQVTALFLLVFVVQLFIYGFHELSEAAVLPYSETLHWATEPYGPDGRYGQFLTYLLVLLPVGWLVIASLRGDRAAQER